MFEHVPFYHGGTFTHLEYLIFIVSFWMFSLAFVFYMISLLVLKCFRVKREDFEKYSPYVLEYQREEKLVNMAISTGFLRKKTDYVRRTNDQDLTMNVAGKQSIKAIIQNFQFSDDEDEEEAELERRRLGSNLDERLSLLRKNTKNDESLHKEVERSIAQGISLSFKTRSDYKDQIKNLMIVQKYKELMNFKDIVTDYVKPPLSFSIGTKISFTFRFMAAVFLAVLPCIFSGFEIINTYIGSIIAFLILFLAYRSSLNQRTSRKKKKKQKITRLKISQREVKGILKYLGWLDNCNEFKIEGYLSFCVILMLSLLMVSVFTGCCLTVGSTPLGIPIPIGFKTASLTTGFIRVFKNESLNCYDKAGPCHFVATVGREAATEALVTIHLPTNYSIADITLYYDEDKFYNDPENKYMRNIANKSNVTNVWKMQRYIITYYIQNLKPDTIYKFIARMKQGYNEEYDKNFYQNISCLAYIKNGNFNQMKCDKEQNPGVANTVPHLLYKTLPESSKSKELKMVSMSDIGTSHDVDNWLAGNKDIDGVDLILMNGNIAMDNGEINCYCLWDYVFQDLETLFARAGRIIPILPNIGDMDIGFKAKNFTGFLRKMNHYSNEGFRFLPMNLFLPSYSPSAWVKFKEKGMLKYNISGVDLITFDGGYFTDLSDPYRKQEFQKMTLKSDYVVVMVYGSIFPACALNEYEYDTVTFRKHWKPIFDLRADIVIEGSSFGLKREVSLISMDPKSTETVYIGDSYISGEPVDNTTKCYNGDVDPDEYNKKSKDKNIWFLNIKNGRTTVTAKNLEKVLDTYSFDMNKEGV